MAECVKIRVQEPYDYIPAQYIEADGYVYLDLKKGFDLRETKQVTELNGDNKLTFTFQMGFDLPWSDKNFSILKKYLHSNHIDNDRAQVPVDVVYGSTVTSENQLYVKKGKGKKITAELKLDVNHWAIKGSDLKLKDIPQGDFTFEYDNIIDVLENQHIYDPNNLGIWLPFIDYGIITRDHSLPGRTFNFALPNAYIRPWYHVTSILEKGFCLLGFTFQSDLFNSLYGKSLLCYLIDRSYGLNDPRVPLLTCKALVENSTPLAFQYLSGSIAVVPFADLDGAIGDPGANFHSGNAFYTANGEVDVKARVRLRVEKKETVIKFTYGSLTQVTTTGSGPWSVSPFYNTSTITTAEDDQVIEFEFEVKAMPVSDLDRFGIFISRSNIDSEITVLNNEDEDGVPISEDEGTFIEYTGVRKYWDIGDTVNLADLIDSEWLFLDFLKGVSHFFNLKWFTNFRTLEVLALQPYDVTLMGESIGGYYIEQSIEDIIGIIDPKSYETESPETENPRYIKLLFKDSTDEYIKELPYKEPLYSHTQDMGPKFTVDEPEERENPFFEATAEGSVAERLPALSLSITKMRDGSRMGWNFRPRMIVGHGMRRININNTGGPGTGDPGLRILSWANPSRKLIPVAGQFIRYLIGDAVNDDTAVVFAAPEDNNVFGINEELGDYSAIKTLYWDMYRRWLQEQLNNMGIQYLAELTNADFRGIDFRSYYLIEHLGRLVKVRIKQIVDYHYCSNIFTPVDFVPEIQASDLCGFITGDPTGNPTAECANYPKIICTEIGGGCYEFAIGGINTSIIDSIEWFKGPAASGPYMSLGLGLTGTVCSEINDYYIKAVVTYLAGETACPPVTAPPKKVVPCPALDWEIKCAQFSDAQTGVTITRAYITSNDPLVPSGSWTVVSFERSDELGPVFNWMPYVENTEIIGNVVSVFRATVQMPGCFPVDIDEVNCTPPQNSPTPCNGLDVDLVCTTIEGGNCREFTLEGYIPIWMEIDYIIKWRASEDDGATWTPWKIYEPGDTDACGTLVQGKVMIHFCDDVCPAVCLYATCEEADGCEPFNTGTPTNIGTCNNGDI